MSQRISTWKESTKALRKSNNDSLSHSFLSNFTNNLYLLKTHKTEAPIPKRRNTPGTGEILKRWWLQHVTFKYQIFWIYNTIYRRNFTHISKHIFTSLNIHETPLISSSVRYIVFPGNQYWSYINNSLPHLMTFKRVAVHSKPFWLTKHLGKGPLMLWNQKIFVINVFHL